MAFNFLGTLSLEQLNDLKSFLHEQIESIDEEVNTLIVERENARKTKVEFVKADAAFGGTVLYELYEQELPEVVNVPDQDDGDAAKIMEEIKRPFIPHIKYKRERIEFKIKKLTDYIEQLDESIDRKLIAKTKTAQSLGSLEQMFNSKHANHLFRTTKEMKSFKQGVLPTTV